MRATPPKHAARSRTVTAYLLGLQAVISISIGMTVLLAPAAQGTMLAVPIMPGARANLAKWVINAGGTLSGTGHLPGSIMINGSRASLLPAALAHGAILIAPPTNDDHQKFRDPGVAS